MNGTLNATTKGCVYQNDYPVALLVGGTLRVVGGQVTATSDGRNGNDGCQGYGIKANALEIGGGEPSAPIPTATVRRPADTTARKLFTFPRT